MIVRRLTQRIRIIPFFLTIFLALSLALCGWEEAIAAPLSDADGGYWETIPMPPQKDRMQSVHTNLLPNGKILMVNGSSFRSRYYIDENGKEHFKEGVDPNNQEFFNNSGLFDPATGTFEHIPSPPSLLYDEELKAKTGNDLFCSGHVQLADGNVLFVGGTARYYPGGAFSGSKWLQLYNWRTGEWSKLGQMKDGRWYPSVISLHDGKVAIFSGLKFGTPNEVNTSLEIYDPETQKLQYIDLTRVRNSPFNTKVKNEYDQDLFDSIDLYPRIFSLADGRLLITGDDAGIAGVLVPHFSKKSYLMSIDETGSGEVSVSFEVGPDRIEPTKAYGTALQIPNSEDVLLFGGIIGTNSISYGRGGNTENFPKGSRVATSLQHWKSPEKNSGNNIGEWEISKDFLDKPRANLQAVILPDKEILVINGGEFPEYKPIYEPLLLTPDENETSGYKKRSLSKAHLPRLYHNGAILLPDGRVFIVGGNANRAGIEENGTVHVDVLGDSKTFFTTAKLTNKSGEEEKFDIDTFYEDPQHYYVECDRKRCDKEPFVPAEIWQPEIFSPPYLFKSGERPEILSAPDTLKYNQSGTIKVKDSTTDSSLVLVKLGSVTHSFDYGQRLVDLHGKKSIDFPIQQGDNPLSNSMPMVRLPKDETLIEFKTPTNAHLYPPGHYMMFYINDSGVPSTAKIVKLEA